MKGLFGFVDSWTRLKTALILLIQGLNPLQFMPSPIMKHSGAEWYLKHHPAVWFSMMQSFRYLISQAIKPEKKILLKQL